MSSYNRRILIGITGSVAAYKSAELISRLKKEGFDLECVATPSALRFIGASALEALTGRQVHTEMFADSHRIHHINLASWSDLTIVYPASADSIARFRSGRADDLLSAVFLAQNFSSPWWIAPAMNSSMLAHPATVENLGVLKDWGARILPTEEGQMACGTYGSGRLLDPEQVMHMILEWEGSR
jgi:phosphopantothenoylcysteine decarboxylase/phosphopantothenate--cysteine ligase